MPSPVKAQPTPGGKQTTLFQFFPPARPPTTVTTDSPIYESNDVSNTIDTTRAAELAGHKRRRSDLAKTPPGEATPQSAAQGLTPSSSTGTSPAGDASEPPHYVGASHQDTITERGTNQDGDCNSGDDDDCALGELLGLTARATTDTVDIPVPTRPRELLSPQQQQQQQQSQSQPSHALRQTFLDLGQSASLSLGRTCPKCGMLYTDQPEDVSLHRRVCKSLTANNTNSGGGGGMIGGGGSNAGASTTAVEPLAQSPAAVRTLELLHKQSFKISSSSSSVRACEKILEDARREVHLSHPNNNSNNGNSDSCPSVAHVTYVLRCGCPQVVQSPDCVRLLEALGFYDAVLEAVDYTVVLVVSAAAQRVLAAVAGRAASREQDPQLYVDDARPDGRTLCGHRRAFTFCDVSYAYVAPQALLSRAAQASWRGSAAAAVASQRDALRSFFAAGAARQQQRTSERRQARRAGEAALRRALMSLAGAVVYGHRLSPASDFSYSTNILRSATTKASSRGRSPQGSGSATATATASEDCMSVALATLVRCVRGGGEGGAAAAAVPAVDADKENREPSLSPEDEHDDGGGELGPASTGLFFHADHYACSSSRNNSCGFFTGGLAMRDDCDGDGDMDRLSVVSYDD